jgi:protein-S-isoprenylcysteine O-methyltransferase Ste14
MLVAAGFFVVYRVFRENTFTAGTIEIAEQQTVVSTGPYAVVRHPMYAGALILLLGTPLALGSWWDLLSLFPMTAVLVARLLDEEEYLARGLRGYREYCQKVRFRLLPFVW